MWFYFTVRCKIFFERYIGFICIANPIVVTLTLRLRNIWLYHFMLKLGYCFGPVHDRKAPCFKLGLLRDYACLDGLIPRFPCMKNVKCKNFKCLDKVDIYYYNTIQFQTFIDFGIYSCGISHMYTIILKDFCTRFD
jgi:hypothetical protein